MDGTDAVYDCEDDAMKRLIILVLILIAAPCFGATYYFDPGAAAGGNGSFATPWNSLSQVAAKTFATGDDLYFRAGTSITINSSNKRFVINWHGSESDQVIIGAYHIVGGQPVIGLGEYARPIFDGGGVYPDNVNWAMISHTGVGHVTVQDLHTKDTYGGGIWLMQAWNAEGIWGFGNEVKNCHIINSGRQGILIARASNCLVEDNYINGTSLTATYIAGSTTPRYAGAGLEITGMDSEQTARNNVVRGNTVTRSNETIGIYKGAYNTLVENNICYDTVGPGIYSANSRRGIIRNNLVYNVPDANRQLPTHPRGTRNNTGIWVDAEGHVASIIKITGEWEIYNNRVAGMNRGIWIQNNANEYVFQHNNKIYNNRIVDSLRNIWIHQAVVGWSGNEIHDNYSFVFETGHVHVYVDMSPPGVTWNANTYNTDIDNTVSGNAATNSIQALNANLGSSQLAKTSGWYNLMPGEVVWGDFAFVGESATPDPEPDPDPTLDSGNALTTGLTRAYIFDEGSGTSAFDHTANDAHMTLTNPAWDTLGLTMSSAGQVAAASVPAFGDSFSIFMAYTSTGTVSQDYAKFLYYYNANVRDLQIERFTSDTEIRSDIGGTTDNTVAWTPVTDTFDQKFHTLLLTYNRTAGERCLYINGSLQSCQGATWTNPTWTGNMYIGGKSDGTRVLGATIHAFYAWSSVLSAADALSLHNDYDQIFLSPPSRTFEGVLPPFNFSGTIDGSRPKVIMDSTKPITIILGQ